MRLKSESSLLASFVKSSLEYHCQATYSGCG